MEGEEDQDRYCAVLTFLEDIIHDLQNDSLRIAPRVLEGGAA